MNHNFGDVAEGYLTTVGSELPEKYQASAKMLLENPRFITLGAKSTYLREAIDLMFRQRIERGQESSNSLTGKKVSNELLRQRNSKNWKINEDLGEALDWALKTSERPAYQILFDTVIDYMSKQKDLSAPTAAVTTTSQESKDSLAMDIHTAYELIEDIIGNQKKERGARVKFTEYELRNLVTPKDGEDDKIRKNKERITTHLRMIAELKGMKLPTEGLLDVLSERYDPHGNYKLYDLRKGKATSYIGARDVLGGYFPGVIYMINDVLKSIIKDIIRQKTFDDAGVTEEELKEIVAMELAPPIADLLPGTITDIPAPKRGLPKKVMAAVDAAITEPPVPTAPKPIEPTVKSLEELLGLEKLTLYIPRLELSIDVGAHGKADGKEITVFRL